MKSLPLHLPKSPRDVIRLAASTQSGGATSSDRDALEKAAYERGRIDAEKMLRDQMMQQRAELASVQSGVLQSLRSASSQVVRQSEALLVELALEVSRRLVAGMTITPDMVSAAVREALEQVETSTEITVQLHPDDLALFEKIPTTERPGADLPEPIRLHGSALLERGGCIVQTRFGLIDNQRDTKLRHLKESLAA